MKKWRNLFISNFLGVFNDNFLKNAIIFVAIAWKMPVWLTQSQLIAVVSASLVLPYLLLSPVGGMLAVQYSKLKVFRFLKLMEFPIMLLACFAFIFEWIFIAILSVLLMGIQSCLYSPAKYGLIRDIGGVEGSAYGSGMFETMAFLGILTGTLIASWLSDLHLIWIFPILFMLVAAGGYYSAIRVKTNELPSDAEDLADIHLSPWRFLQDSRRLSKKYKRVNSAIVGVSIFWLLGALLQMNIIIHAKAYYEVSNTATGIVMAFAAVGVALGTWLAGVFLSKGNQDKMMLGGLSGMIVCLLIIMFGHIDFPLFLVMVFLTACSGGFFQVPNLTVIQRSDSGKKLGQLLAYMNLMIFIFVSAATLLFALTMWMTDDNSFAIFGLIASIALITFLIGTKSLKDRKID